MLKLKLFLLLVFVFICKLVSSQNTEDWTLSYDDPVELAKEVIKRTNGYWAPLYRETFILEVGHLQQPSTKLTFFHFFESPELKGSYINQSLQVNLYKYDKDGFETMIDLAIKNPKIFSKRLSEQTIMLSLDEYNEAFGIAKNYISSRKISRNDALRFLELRWSILKMVQADALIDGSKVYKYNHNKELENDVYNNIMISSNDYLLSKNSNPFETIGKSGVDKFNSWAGYCNKLYNYLLSKNVGIANYQPYLLFKKRMDYLNRMKIEEQERLKNYRAKTAAETNPTVVYKPKKKDVWFTNGKQMEVEWKAPMYDANKPMQIILWKGDYIKAFKHISKNTGSFKIISLPETIEPGDDYSISIQPLFVDKNKNEKNYVVYSDQFSIIKKNEDPAFRVSGNNIVPVRTSFAGRSVSYIQELHTKSKYIKITAYDHGRVDGDIISLYLNGKSVVTNYELNSMGRTFEVELEEGIRNDLFLYAHNLGDIAPNTVAIRIFDGYRQQEFVLNSNLQSCEAVVIYLDD